MADALGYEMTRPSGEVHRTTLRRYLHTWSPRYHPAKVDVPDCVEGLLARYSAMVATST